MVNGRKLAWLILGLLAPSAHSASWEDFSRWVSTTQTFYAHFTQSVVVSPQSATPSSLKNSNQSGELWIRFPDALKWQINAPSPQSVWIVANKNSAWIYDPDLQQAIHQPLQTLGAVTPAEILLGSGNLNSLKKNFDLTLEGEWLIAQPKPSAEGSSFQRLKIKMNRLGIETLIAHDALDRQIVLQFSQAQKNLPLSPQLFLFTPPAGVEVIEQGKP